MPISSYRFFFLCNSVLLSFLSCLVWSYIRYLYYLSLVVFLLRYLALRFVADF